LKDLYEFASKRLSIVCRGCGQRGLCAYRSEKFLNTSNGLALHRHFCGAGVRVHKRLPTTRRTSIANRRFPRRSLTPAAGRCLLAACTNLLGAMWGNGPWQKRFSFRGSWIRASSGMGSKTSSFARYLLGRDYLELDYVVVSGLPFRGSSHALIGRIVRFGRWRHPEGNWHVIMWSQPSKEHWWLGKGTVVESESCQLVDVADRGIHPWISFFIIGAALCACWRCGMGAGPLLRREIVFFFGRGADVQCGRRMGLLCTARMTHKKRWGL